MRRDHTVFLDIETGGLKFDAPIIQIAAVAIKGWEEIDFFERKILFSSEECDPEALRICRYDPEVWNKSAIQESAACAQLDYFLRRYQDLQRVSHRGRPFKVARVAGHNIKTFDLPRLRKMMERSGFKFFPGDWMKPLDTLELAVWRTFDKDDPPKSHKLGDLLDYFNIPHEDELHDALADVRGTVQLARALLEGRSGSSAPAGG